MSNYRRALVPGATYFFTVTLEDRTSDLLVREIKVLREAYSATVWEHQIRDEEDLARHVEYIHFNPVKHGLVAQVKDWPHSSFHKWVERGDLPAAWGLAKQAGGKFGE